MCGRYTLARSQQELSERFGVKQVFIDFSPRYNIAPTQKLPVILCHNGQKVIEELKWGLIPFWVKDLKKAKALINARCETLAEKPSFKTALLKRRCLVPADGFYEWKKTGGKKKPYLIRKKDNSIFAFAGIWDEWKSEAGELLRTFSIITTDANQKMSPVHDRMPVILPPSQEENWLDPELKDQGSLLSLLRPCPDELITLSEVSDRVNSVKFDSPQLMEPEHKPLSEPEHKLLSEPEHKQLSEPEHKQLSEPEHKQLSEPEHKQLSEPEHKQLSLQDLL